MPLVLLLSAPGFAADGSMTKAERAYLLSQLKTSKIAMLASIKGLTPAQWTFKPAPEVWSVQECAEHIILAEEYIFGASQKYLATPAVPRLATATSEADAKFVARIEDRSAKAKAPEPIKPTGKFPTPQSAAQEFKLRRDKTIAYAKTTQDALRVHSGPGPAGPMDAYQFLLLVAAHSARHTAQIREVEANPQYPKANAKAAILSGVHTAAAFR
jgi:hypothetical protein